MILKLLECRSPVIDLEKTIERLKTDIKFYTCTAFHNVDIEDAKEKLQEYDDALKTIKDKHGK